MKLPIFTLPNSTLKNKTGGWRTFKPGVDLDKCTGCGICTKVCPEGIISLCPRGDLPGKNSSRPKAVINFDYCKGCGICAGDCPFKAIVMELENK